MVKLLEIKVIQEFNTKKSMNKTYKIIGRHPYTKRQVKKRVYTSTNDFLKYSEDLINRYKTYLNVEIYELKNDEWLLILEVDYIGGSYLYKKYEDGKTIHSEK